MRRLRDAWHALLGRPVIANCDIEIADGTMHLDRCRRLRLVNNRIARRVPAHEGSP